MWKRRVDGNGNARTYEKPSQRLRKPFLHPKNQICIPVLFLIGQAKNIMNLLAPIFIVSILKISFLVENDQVFNNFLQFFSLLRNKSHEPFLTKPQLGSVLGKSYSIAVISNALHFLAS
jgi:hypothetical protein